MQQMSFTFTPVTQQPEGKTVVEYAEEWGITPPEAYERLNASSEYEWTGYDDYGYHEYFKEI